jgi:ORF6N domain
MPLMERRIYLIRGHKVLLDSDLAVLYEVGTRLLNQRSNGIASALPRVRERAARLNQDKPGTDGLCVELRRFWARGTISTTRRSFDKRKTLLVGLLYRRISETLQLVAQACPQQIATSAPMCFAPAGYCDSALCGDPHRNE